ncbi:MAG: hypothetical protein KF832_26415 [Caldilineaceae bacterium]|nr:hypothetical protein [Caldilineaceae bacterium]
MNFRNRLIPLLTLLWLLTACAVAPSNDSPAPAAQPAALTPAADQALIVGLPSDNFRTDERANLGMYYTGIYDVLVRMTPDYQLIPMLATEWEFVEPNTWRFILRQGVTFHDGQPFTAAAVKATMDRLAAIGSNSAQLGPDSTQIIDDYTVEITPTTPNRRLLQQLAHPSYSIIAPGSDPATQPIGTGSFKFVDYVKGEHLMIERNPDYWGTVPTLSKITFRFIPDNNTRVLALQAGEIHLAYNVPREVAGTLAETDGLTVATSPVGAYEAIYVNVHGEEPYTIGQEPAVRAALAHAIDESTIVNDVWLGNAEINTSMIPVRILGDAAQIVQGTPYDPSAAQQLLEEAGWVDADGDGVREKEGRPLQLVMVVGYPIPEIHQPLPEIVQAQLRAVGIDLKIETTPDTASYEARLELGEGDLWVEIGNQNDANPCFLPGGLFYSKSTWGAYPRLFAPGAEFDTYLEACQSAVTVEEVKQNAAEAMRVVIDQEKIVLPVAGIFNIYGLSTKVQGFAAHPSGVNQRWEELFLSE